jgi:alanine racemase
MTTPSAGRPTFAAVNAAALRQNFAALRAAVGPHVAILAVVKADAYGHGAALVTPLLEATGADHLGVATVDEGVELRAAGIRKPILVLTGIGRHDLSAVRAHRLSVAILHREMVRELAEAGPGAPLPVHIKVDTGMGRIGVLPAELPTLLDDIRKAGTFALEGVFSHFANADSVDRDYSDYQLTAFRQAIAALQAAGARPRWIHLANSAAVLTRPDAHFSMVRPGIALYGVSPLATAAPSLTSALRPVMRLVTHVWQLKPVPAEFPISYGQTFVTGRPSRIATLPIGYADGYSRALSNRASVLIRGRRAPVVGRVCMDLTMVDVTDIGGVQLGDEVVLWGNQNGATISVSEVAAWQETIPYEVLTGVGKRVPRILE